MRAFMTPRRRLLQTALLLASVFVSGNLDAQDRVRGYFRKDGTYVRPHIRSAPDRNPYNNYAFPGNYNPNTGKISTGDPLTYLKRYYRQRAPASHAIPYGSARAWAAPDISSLRMIPVALPPEELQRASSYCSWLYGMDRVMASRCTATQEAALATLTLPDYTDVPTRDLARSASYCEWLYGDNRAGFYDCLNGQIFGLQLPRADLTGVPVTERRRSESYCEWLYNNNREGYEECMRGQSYQLSQGEPDASQLPPAEWTRSVRYCEWLYSNNRGGALECRRNQAAELLKRLPLMSRAPNPDAHRYCEWLYNDNRAGYWGCIASRS